MLNSVLVLSPHRDDEVLGAGGTLPQCKKLHIHYFNNIHPEVSVDVYDKEAENVQKALGCTVSYSTFNAVNRLHLFPITNYISEIEGLINTLKPSTILIPANSHNQDHKVVYDAAIVALRFHDTNWNVPNVLVYEQTEYMNGNFTPNMFVPIDINQKLALFSLYKSQQRGHRTHEYITALATLRGMKINVPYAEAFMILRQTWQSI